MNKCDYDLCKVNGQIRYVIQLYYGLPKYPSSINVRYYDSVECMSEDLEQPITVDGLKKEEVEFKWRS